MKKIYFPSFNVLYIAVLKIFTKLDFTIVSTEQYFDSFI